MKLLSVNTGKPAVQSYGRIQVETGIEKTPREGGVRLGFGNLEGDRQADLQAHGGPDKAVCVYCFEHYPYWERELGRKLGAAAFGENFTVSGMTEEEVCIGDIFRIGTAVVQITQPRQPCHKLAGKHALPDLPVRVQNTGHTGYYFRVLEEGTVRAGAGIERLQPHPLGITVAFANRIKHHDKNNAEGIRAILAVDALSANWRQSFEERLERLGAETGAGREGDDAP